MWGPRAQIDRDLYKQHLQEKVFHNTPNLDVIEASVEDLIVENVRKNNVGQKCFDCHGVILSRYFLA